MSDLIKFLRTSTSSAYNKVAADRIEELEAKLTKAVKALRKIADYTHIGEFGQAVTQHAEARIARAVLAALEK